MRGIGRESTFLKSETFSEKRAGGYMFLGSR